MKVTFLRSAAGKRILSLAILSLFLVFLPFASSGKVFLSRLLAKVPSLFDANTNWRMIYQAAMTVNGGRASISVYGCDEPMPAALAWLKKNCGAIKENYFMAGEKAAWLLSTADGRITRLLALALPDAEKSVVFVLAQSPVEFSKSTLPPSASTVPGHLLLPASRLETIIQNEETGAALETRLADGAPAAILNEISDKLARDGWQTIYPAGNDNASRPSFLIFQRRNALCTVMTGPALCESKSCVTILTKEIAK